MSGSFVPASSIPDGAPTLKQFVENYLKAKGPAHLKVRNVAPVSASARICVTVVLVFSFVCVFIFFFCFVIAACSITWRARMKAALQSLRGPHVRSAAVSVFSSRLFPATWQRRGLICVLSAGPKECVRRGRAGDRP
jgi:hypothetical protein